MGWSVRTQGGEQLKELQARIKEAGDKGMNRKFRKEVRRAGAATVEKVKARALTVKVKSLDPPRSARSGRHHGPRSSGLRARVARAVGISQTKKGIRIRVSARKVGAYGVTLPRYLDASLGGRWARWRHPVFWPEIGTAPPTRVVGQTGGPYFFVVIRGDRAKFRAAVIVVMEQTAKELTA
jgi:hypothetical protein